MKIIFARNGGFGDNIWTEPIVRHFLNQGEEVMVQVAHPCIFDHYPSGRLWVNCPEKLFPLPNWPLSLRFEEMPRLHPLEAFRIQAGIPEMALTYPQLHLSEEEKKRKISKKYAVFHLNQYKQEPYRNILGVDWAKVFQHVRSKGIEPIQLSAKGDDLVAQWFPTKDLRDVMSLIYHSEFFVGSDSGPSHIASAFTIPSVIFFGSVNPRWRHLNQERKVFLQSPCSFPHCYHEKPYQLGQPCRLVEEGGSPPCCIFDADRVIEAIVSLETLQSNS